MSEDKKLNEHDVRIAVLEKQYQNVEAYMVSLKREVDLCKADHTKATDKLEARMNVLETVVDDLRINTELTRQTLESMTKMHEGMDRLTGAVQSIQSKLTRQDGIVAGVVLLGGTAWGLFLAFKEPVMKLFGF